MSPFDWLAGLSPWWWVAAGIALGALEMATMSFFLIWPGIAAVLTGALVALMPTMPGELRLAVFAALAVALTFAGRAVMRRWGDGGDPPGSLNRRAAQMIGRRGTLIARAGGDPKVEIDGIPWQAQFEGDGAAADGSPVEVVGVAGMTLTVRQIGQA